MIVDKIESKLLEDGINAEGLVVWAPRQQYYAVGFEASELPTVNGHHPVDDPRLAEQS